jgi:hypothetical protein
MKKGLALYSFFIRLAKSLVWLIIRSEEEGGGGEGSRHLGLKCTINHALTIRTIFAPFIALELKGSHFLHLTAMQFMHISLVAHSQNCSGRHTSEHHHQHLVTR